MGALIVTAWIVFVATQIWSRHGRRGELVRPVWLLVFAVAGQITLGALVVLSRRQPIINTMHVATGALILGTSLVITLRLFRFRFGSAASNVLPAGLRPAAPPASQVTHA